MHSPARQFSILAKITCSQSTTSFIIDHFNQIISQQSKHTCSPKNICWCTQESLCHERLLRGQTAPNLSPPQEVATLVMQQKMSSPKKSKHDFQDGWDMWAWQRIGKPCLIGFRFLHMMHAHVAHCILHTYIYICLYKGHCLFRCRFFCECFFFLRCFMFWFLFSLIFTIAD